jgi:hypothetical protein
MGGIRQKSQLGLLIWSLVARGWHRERPSLGLPVNYTRAGNQGWKLWALVTLPQLSGGLGGVGRDGKAYKEPFSLYSRNQLKERA